MKLFLNLIIGTFIIGLSFAILPNILLSKCLIYSEYNFIEQKFDNYKVCFATKEQQKHFVLYVNNYLYQQLYINYYENRTKKKFREETLYTSKSLLSS